METRVEDIRIVWQCEGCGETIATTKASEVTFDLWCTICKVFTSKKIKTLYKTVIGPGENDQEPDIQEPDCQEPEQK